MKVVGLEEHVVFPDVLDAWLDLPPQLQDLALRPATSGDFARRLLDLGNERLAAMATTGVDVQVLSLAPPGLQNLEAKVAVPLQSRVNDRIAEAVRNQPEHYQGLAALATADPVAAARELERAIGELGLSGVMLYGRTRDRFLDDPALLPVLETAAALRAPVHLHPQSPLQSVRDAYYTGFGSDVDAAFADHALGWHFEAGVQVVRLVLAGVFERLPQLQVIVGHWGELVLSYLDRLEHLVPAARLPRPFTETVRHNLYITPSGMLNPRSLRSAVEMAGADRVMFSTDYPFEPASRAGAATFLSTAALPGPDRDAISSGNWARLVAGIDR